MSLSKRILGCGLAIAISLLSACGGSDSSIQDLPAQPQQAPPESTTIPELAGLDGLHGASAIVDHQIPVTEPIAERHTQVSGASLEFIPPMEEMAYALYRIIPPGPPLTLSAAGEGPLWLLVADYGTGSWVMEPFADGHAGIDPAALLTQTAILMVLTCGPSCRQLKFPAF